MKCPIDNAELVMSERQNIEIDYCPTCRGVWLDRGELDKMIERTPEVTQSQAPQPMPREEYRRPQEHHREERSNYDSHGGYGHKKHKKESFLGDLFDF